MNLLKSMTMLLSHMAYIAMFGGLIAFATSPKALASSPGLSNSPVSVDRNKSFGRTRAAAQAQAQYGGKVLSVTKLGSGNETYYKVKLLLDNGRIKIVKIRGS